MLQNQRYQFDIPEDCSYLNCAYMSPISKEVAAAGIQGITSKYRPFEISPQDFFDDVQLLKEEFARLICCDQTERVVQVPSVSYGIANAAANIKFSKGSTILLVAEQFPSNYYYWERISREKEVRLKLIKPPELQENRGREWNQRILEAINKDTAVISLGHVHWADGTRFDLEAIRKRSRDVEALMIIDGTQSVGALPFDIQRFEPDALICGGYKWLFGPYGMGMAYYGEYFDNGKPLEENWINRKDSQNFQNLVQYQDQYQAGAGRYAVGEQSNFILVPMMIAALRQINGWGVANIHAYCQELAGPYLKELENIGCQIEEEEWRGAHLLGIRLGDQFDQNRLKETLQRRKVFVSVRGNAIRVSVNVFNTPTDFERLFACFKESLSASSVGG